MSQSQRLTMILAVNVAGYHVTRRPDEEVTLRCLQEHRGATCEENGDSFFGGVRERRGLHALCRRDPATHDKAQCGTPLDERVVSNGDQPR